MKRFLLLLIGMPCLCFSQKPEKWIQKPMAQWPAIALVNDVLYKNGDRYEDPTITYAASGFLLDTAFLGGTAGCRLST